MKAVKEIYNKFLYRATLCFTLVLISLAIIGVAVNSVSKAIYCSQVLYMLGFGVLVGISFGIADFVKGNVVIRRAVQFILSYTSFILMFFVGGAGKSFLENQSQNKVFTVICGSLFFIGIYVVIAAVNVGYKAFLNLLANRRKNYTPQFDEINKDNN